MKLCECGCGEPAPIAKRTSRRAGWIKGQPTRFICNHDKRKPVCTHGHPKTPENTFKSGGCKLCKQAAEVKQRRSAYNRSEAGKQALIRYRQTELGKITTVNVNARRRGAVGEVSVEDWRTLCEITNGCCACCGLDRQTLFTMKRVLAVDHIVPISAGGTNTADNVQPLCDGRRGSVGACNQVKGTQTINYLTKFEAAV
jgi:hypothetical protein